MRTIFDIGMHRGDDAAFYIKKGFRVVSLEPFPDYVIAARAKFASEIAAGQLVLIQKAVSDAITDSITFFVNKNKDDSHTIREDLARNNIISGVFEYEEIEVDTITLSELFDTYDVPYYMKCDIEGADEQVVGQLISESRRPQFISFEISSVEIIRKMKMAGYQSFQLVNQWLNPTLSMPIPPREGLLVELQFNGHMSGLFGRELPPSKWYEVDSAIRLYELWLEIQQIDPAFAIGGWVDCHASMQSLDKLRD